MRLIATALFAVCAGCSLDAAGTADNLTDGGTNDVTVTPDTDHADSIFVVDDTAPGDDTAPPPDTTPLPDTTPPPDTKPPCDESTCEVLPTGAKRVALVDRSVACPAGFKQTDVVEETANNACSCSCSLSASPTCPGTGTIATRYGTTTSCESAGASVTSSGSGVCSSLGTTGALSGYFSGTAPGPIGGACTPAGVTDPSVISRQRRICEPDIGTCAAPVCSAPFIECIEVAGACPSSFPNARRIGLSASVVCPPCTCNVTGGCTGSITFFGNPTCGGGTTTFPVDGACHAVPMSAGSAQSFKYNPNAVTGAMCNASYTTAPGTRTFAGARTLCCN